MNPRILVVDDEPRMGESVQRLLEAEGYRVETATSAREAVEALGREPADLVITDLRMPRVGGLELITYLKLYHPKIPVIVMTGYASVESAIEALRQGVYDYLVKPFDYDHLKRAVARALEKVALEKKVEEITQKLLETQEELKRQAITDGLTGLVNYRHLYATLETEVARALRHHTALCVAILDLDYFKEINDTHGHLVGDQILQEVAACIRETVRETDVVGRYGGDEFVLILPETLLQDAQRMMHRVHRHLGSHVFGKPKLAITLTASVGISSLEDLCLPPHPSPGIKPSQVAQELIQRADHCLYQAKQTGRNRVYCERSRETPASSPERGSVSQRRCDED